MDGSAAVKVAGTGTEQTRVRSAKQGVVSKCDAKCDAIVADRIELLTRAVILVAGMNLAEAERAAVLAPWTTCSPQRSRQARFGFTVKAIADLQALNEARERKPPCSPRMAPDRCRSPTPENANGRGYSLAR